ALPMTLLIVLALRGQADDLGTHAEIVATWALATTASAIFWTLLAKSSLGSATLNIGFHSVVFSIWAWLTDGYKSQSLATVEAISIFLYSSGMILLGWILFSRFQPVEGQAELTIIPGARRKPNISISWLRCRPREAILNLIRREIGLLRVVWLLSLFSLVAWIFVAALRSGYSDDSWFASLTTLLAMLLSFLIALLAGALSLGEEKTSGTYAWHLTLPISIPLQWFV